MNKNRTWCKYGNCFLEKFEEELQKLIKIWNNLEKNWVSPQDFEDLYRIYPLIDTTAALGRKMLVKYGKKNKKYKVEVILPSNNCKINTTKYLYSDESKFFNGKTKNENLADIVSKFLHASEYKYIDNRKEIENMKEVKIYIFISTDILCESCREANLPNPEKEKYRTTHAHVRFSDCTCGRYVNVRSYIDALSNLLSDSIPPKN